MQTSFELGFSSARGLRCGGSPGIWRETSNFLPQAHLKAIRFLKSHFLAGFTYKEARRQLARPFAAFGNSRIKVPRATPISVLYTHDSLPSPAKVDDKLIDTVSTVVSLIPAHDTEETAQRTDYCVHTHQEIDAGSREKLPTREDRPKYSLESLTSVVEALGTRADKVRIEDKHAIIPEMAAFLSTLPPEQQQYHAPSTSYNATSQDPHDPRSHPLFDLETVDMVAVFDGHGGDGTSTRAADWTPKMFASDGQLWADIHEIVNDIHDTDDTDTPCECPAKVQTAIERSFGMLDGFLIQYQAQHETAPRYSGSTALMGIQTGKHLFVANVGDSRAVLCRGKTAIRLSTDHKPCNELDVKRILNNQHAKLDFSRGAVRVCYAISSVSAKYITMSRALGDLDWKERNLVTAHPSVTYHHLDPSDQFVIYASDGLWDVMSDQRAVNLALSFMEIAVTHEDLKLQGQDVVDFAADGLKEIARADGSNDDITVVIRKFDWAKMR